MRLGFDLDEVVVALMDRVIPIVNFESGRTFTTEDITDYNLRCIGIKDMETFINYYPSIHSSAKPVKDADRYIPRLTKSIYDIYFVTARDHYKGIRQVTENWLAEKGIPCTKLITHARHNKDKILEKEKIDFYVDDNPFEIEAILKNTPVEAYLMDRPWNRKFDMPRVYNWEQIYKKIIERWVPESVW